MSYTVTTLDELRKKFDDTTYELEDYSMPITYACGTFDLDPCFPVSYKKMVKTYKILEEVGGIEWVAEMWTIISNGMMIKKSIELGKEEDDIPEPISVVGVGKCILDVGNEVHFEFSCGGKSVIHKKKRHAIHVAITHMGRHCGLTTIRVDYPKSKSHWKLVSIKNERRSSKRKREVSLKNSKRRKVQ